MKTTLIIFFISIITLSTLRDPEATTQNPIIISAQELQGTESERALKATYFEISEAQLNVDLTARQLNNTSFNRLMYIFRNVNGDTADMDNIYSEVESYRGHFIASRTVSGDSLTPKYVPS